MVINIFCHEQHGVVPTDMTSGLKHGNCEKKYWSEVNRNTERPIIREKRSRPVKKQLAYPTVCTLSVLLQFILCTCSRKDLKFENLLLFTYT